MARRLVFLAFFLLLLFGPGLAGRGEEPKKDADKDKDKLSELMRKKLKHSQKVLEGIAVSDFKMISENADELVLISRDAEWRVSKTPRYEIFSNEFRRAAEDMIQNSKDKNLDRAALNYVELTLTCVKCHRFVREERGTFRDLDREGIGLADSQAEPGD
jgi:hypothetical protein